MVDKVKVPAVFLAALCKMFDRAHHTIGGLKESKSRDRILCSFEPPQYNLVATSSDFWHDNSLGGLKNKHYALGLAATHYVNMYLQGLENTPSKTVKYFVDPSYERDAPSMEIIYLGNWIIFQREICPKDFHFKTRKEIDQYIKEMVFACIEEFVDNKRHVATDEERKKIVVSWEKFAEKYYTEANEMWEAFFGKDAKDVKGAKDVKETKILEDISKGSSILNVFFAKAYDDSPHMHIVPVGKDEALCGMSAKLTFKNDWVVVRSTVGGVPICKSCQIVAAKESLDFEDKELPADNAPLDKVFFLGKKDVGTPHLGFSNDDIALCGATAKITVSQDKWDFLPYQTVVCSKCAREAENNNFPLREHLSCKPAHWVKWPHGKKVHLAQTGTADSLCDIKAPQGEGWRNVQTEECVPPLYACSSCIEHAILEEVDVPLGFSQAVETIEREWAMSGKEGSN